MPEQNQKSFSIGVMFRREFPPSQTIFFAQLAEKIGFDEVWFVEDLSYAGGISQVSTALTATSNITVGLGIMPVMVRNAAFVAMEISTLANLFPGRFIAGFGHGVSGWMKQVGAYPKSQIQAMYEMIFSINRLMQGEKLTFSGSYVHLEDIYIKHVPENKPSIFLGVSGPKSLEISSKYANGTLLPEHNTIKKVKWVKNQVTNNKLKTNDQSDHKIALYIWCSVNKNEEFAYNEIRPIIAQSIEQGSMTQVFQELNISNEAINKLKTNDNWSSLIPKEWIDPIAIVGTPENCIKKINSFVEAGVKNLILVPLENQSPVILNHYKKLLMTKLKHEGEK